MAEATSFPESNSFLNPPDGMTEEECGVLSIAKGEANGWPVIISCWKLDQEELDEVIRTKRIWLMTLGDSMNPVLVLGNRPKMKVIND